MGFSMDVSEFKGRLLLDVCVLEAKKAALDSLNVPYQIKGRYAIFPRLLIGRKNAAGNYGLSAAVTHEMMLDVGIDMDALFDECRQNSRKLYPGEISKIAEYLEKMEVEPDGIAVPQMYVLTNSSGMNGAAAFFYQPDLIDNLAEMAGADLLIFPAGKNEMFCVPISGSTKIEEIQEMYRKAIELLEFDDEPPLMPDIMQYDHLKHNVRQMDGSTFSLDGESNTPQQAAGY